MRKTVAVHFRADPQLDGKLQQIRKATGWKTSTILRAMIEQFDPSCIDPLSTNSNSDVNIRQDSHVAVVA